MTLRGRRRKFPLFFSPNPQSACDFSLGQKDFPNRLGCGRVAPSASSGRWVEPCFLEEAVLFCALAAGEPALPSLTGVQRDEPAARAVSPVATAAAGNAQRLQMPDQLEHAVPVALSAAALHLALHLQVGAVRALRSHLRAGAVMGGVAEEWRPGRGRRPGWGTLASRVARSADGIRGPGGSGGPGGAWWSATAAAAAAAAAPNAPPGASGLGLRLRDPKESRSSLRRCCSSSCRCRRCRCCSCCHSPRLEPGRRQLRSHPGLRLHPRVGVAIARRAGRAGGQRGHSSQARAGRSRTALRRTPADVWVLTLMLRGARAPGGALLPVPSPSRRDSRPGILRPDRPALCGGPVTATACRTSQIRGATDRTAPAPSSWGSRPDAPRRARGAGDKPGGPRP